MHSPSTQRASGPGDAERPGTTGSASPLEEAATSATGAESGNGPQRWRPQRRPRLPDVAATAVFAIAGAMFIASATASQDGALRPDQQGGLPGAISARADQNSGLTREVDQLTLQVSSLLEQGNPSTILAETTAQNAVLAPIVGLTPVTGPGVTVSLDDADPPQPIPDGFTGDDYIVHQQDVQGVVNALWRGGASGVTVMGQRLISTSAVRCVGNTVILQGQVYSPPFIIEAVGDVARLTAALEVDDSVRFFREWSDVVGLGYDQSVSREMTLPAYTGPITTPNTQVIP